MTAQDCLAYRDELLHHFVDGAPLSDAARAHYLGCVECIALVTQELSQNAEPAPAPVRTRGVSTRGPAPAELPEAARQALEHGRRVLAREFGIHADTPGA